MLTDAETPALRPSLRSRLTDGLLPAAGQVGAIVRTSGSMVGSLVAAAVLGAAYWWVAARQFDPAMIGFAAALVAIMSLLGTFGGLGLGTMLTREMPRHPGREVAMISAALLGACGLSAILAVGAAFVAGSLSPVLAPLRSDPVAIALFATGVGLTTGTEILDEALIGLLRGGLQLLRNLVFAVAKLAILIGVAAWLVDRSGLVLYATWIVATGLSLGMLVVILLSTRGADASRRPAWGLVLRLGPSALRHHALSLALEAPGWLLPVLVTVIVSAEANAAFYIAWSLAGLTYFVPGALSYTLFAVGARHPEGFAHGVRFTLSLSFLAVGVATLGIALLGSTLLGFYGATYQRDASLALLILTLGVAPLVVKAHFVTIQRIRGRTTGTAVLAAAGSALELILAGLGAMAWGVTGVAIGFAAAMTLEMLVTAPLVVAAATGRLRVADEVA